MNISNYQMTYINIKNILKDQSTGVLVNAIVYKKSNAISGQKKYQSCY